METSTFQGQTHFSHPLAASTGASMWHLMPWEHHILGLM